MRNYIQKGFTLIELLIVIAILGVLAAVVFAAIDPAEQFAKANDAKLKTTVGSLAQAVEANKTSRGSVVPMGSGDGVTATNWLTRVMELGEISAIPAALTDNCVEGAAPGAVGIASNEGNYCYRSNASNFVIYVTPLSKSEKGKCTGVTVPYYVYSSANAAAGTKAAGVYCATATGSVPATAITLK